MIGENIDTDLLILSKKQANDPSWVHLGMTLAVLYGQKGVRNFGSSKEPCSIHSWRIWKASYSVLSVFKRPSFNVLLLTPDILSLRVLGVYFLHSWHLKAKRILGVFPIPLASEEANGSWEETLYWSHWGKLAMQQSLLKWLQVGGRISFVDCVPFVLLALSPAVFTFSCFQG